MIMLSSWMFAKSGREGKNGHALEASSHGQRRPLTDLKIKQFTSRLRSDHVLRRRVSILLTADAARQLGYRNVFSLIGGYKAMLASGWPMRLER